MVQHARHADSSPMRRIVSVLPWVIVACCVDRPARGEGLVSEIQPLDASPVTTTTRLDDVELQLRAVVEENARLSAEIAALKEVASDTPIESSNTVYANPSAAVHGHETRRYGQDAFFAEYANGISIRPRNAKANPFSLRINHQNTIRFTAFDREEESWTDNAGNVNPIFNRNDISIPRGRLIFSGTTLMPKLSYLLNLDYNTVTNNPIGFRAYVLSYRCNDAVQLHAGQNKVPGSREWLHSSFDAQEGPDRSMATTFFRPSLSQGIWITGEPLDGLNYHAMISNGFNTLNVRPNQLDDRYCGSGSLWWEPWGDFGRGYSDIEHHEEAAIRIGGSLLTTRESGSQSSDYPENTLVRLSDGTLITEQGSLAPGVTLQAFHLSLAAFDISYKYRGLGLSTEIYRQGLSSFRGNGPLPIDSLQTYGGVAQGGYFVVPRLIELYSRNSFVTGEFGSGTEVGGGVNWFVLKGKSNLRYTFDLAWLDSSPADQNRTGFIAGQSGCLFRTQITSSF